MIYVVNIVILMHNTRVFLYYFRRL